MRLCAADELEPRRGWLQYARLLQICRVAGAEGLLLLEREREIAGHPTSSASGRYHDRAASAVGHGDAVSAATAGGKFGRRDAGPPARIRFQHGAGVLRSGLGH